MDILSNSTIVADEKFLGLLKNLEDMSFLSSRETIAHYSNNPNFIEYVKQIQVQRIQALQRVKSARALYPNMSEETKSWIWYCAEGKVEICRYLLCNYYIYTCVCWCYSI